MVDIRDTYSVEFNAEQAVQMANRLAKSMQSLGQSLASVKSGGMAEINKILAPLEAGKITNAIKGVNELDKLNKAILSISKNAPNASDIQRIQNVAKGMQGVSTAVQQLGTSMAGISQFVSGLGTQITNFSTGFKQIQSALSSIGQIDVSGLKNMLTSLTKAMDPGTLKTLETQATDFTGRTGAVFNSVYKAVRSVTKITDEMRKLSNLSLGSGKTDGLKTQLLKFMTDLNSLSSIKLKAVGPELGSFASKFKDTYKAISDALLPLYAVFKESEKAVATSARFGQNLNQIILNINKAGASGTTNVNASALQNMRRNVIEMHNALKDLKPALDSIRVAQQAVNSGFVTAGTVGKKAGSDVVLSWGSVVRLFEAHILRRGIYAFTAAIRESVNESAELVKALGEIQTISQRVSSTGRPLGVQRSIEELFQDAKRISEIYGLAQKDVVEAGYQAISNQVRGASENFTFLESSAKFAKAAVTSLDTSVRLLSAALQSYNISSSQTDKVAAIFFKTIELGRLRAADLADDLGRSSTLANQLGISLEELTAAFATTTVQGIKFRNAQTYINNIMLKLIKPTDVMREAFYEMGVDSGEAAVNVYGFYGAMQKLYKVAADTPDTLGELGKLFGTIRGITGAALLKNAGELYDENLAKIRNSQESYLKAYDTIVENYGNKFLLELNKLKTYFTSYGKELIQLTGSMTEFAGGLANVIKYGIQASAVIGGIVLLSKSLNVALVTLKTTFTAFNLTLFASGSGFAAFAAKATTAITTVKSALLGLTGIGGVIASAFFIASPVIKQFLEAGRLTEDEFQEIYKRTKENVDKTVLLRTKLITDQISIINEIASNVFRGAAQRTAEQIRIVREQASVIGNAINSMDKSFEFAVRTTKSGVDSQQNAYNEFKRTLESVISTSQNLGKEFRGSTSELVRNMKEIDNFAINIDRSLSGYVTSIREAAISKLPTQERQAVYQQAGAEELAKGEQYFSGGYISQAQKSFEKAIGYFTQSKDAYIQMVEEFSGGGKGGGAPINFNEFISKVKPIEDFMSQLVYRVFNANRQTLLSEFNTTWEKILYQANKTSGEAYQGVISNLEDPLSAIRRGDAEFADTSLTRLRSLNAQINQLPEYARNLAGAFGQGLIGIEDYSTGIEEVQKKLVEMGDEEKQIIGEVTARQNELAQTRTNAIAAARELFKTSEQLFRTRREATGFRERYELDRQLVELQTRFSTFEKEVGYNFASEFITTLESEKATLIDYLAEQQSKIEDYSRTYFKTDAQKGELSDLNALYEERLRLEKEYESVRFSDRKEDIERADRAREDLATARLKINAFEEQNARLKEAGLLISEQQSIFRSVADLDLRLGQARSGQSLGDVMSDYVERMRQGLKLDSELQRLQKQQQEDYKSLGENLKNLEDTTADATQKQADLQTSIENIIGAFKETASSLIGGRPKYERFFPIQTGDRVEVNGGILTSRAADPEELIAANVNFLRDNLALLQSEDSKIRIAAADELTGYMTKILNQFDIDAKGVLRSTGQEIIKATLDFNKLTETLQNIKGVDFADELETWRSTIIEPLQQPTGIKERSATIGAAETQVLDFIAKLKFAGIEAPEALNSALVSLRQYSKYFEEQDLGLGAFKLSDEIAKIISSISGGGESIYEKILSDNQKALDALSTTSGDLITELQNRAKAIGVKFDLKDGQEGIAQIQRILTSGTEIERAELRQVFATFGSKEDELVETQRTSLTVLKGIELNTRLLMEERNPTQEVVTRARGGEVPNKPNLSKPFGTDSVLAALTPGEFVIRKEAVQSLGMPYLDMLNRTGNIRKRATGTPPANRSLQWLNDQVANAVKNASLGSLDPRVVAENLKRSDVFTFYKEIYNMYKTVGETSEAIYKKTWSIDPSGRLGRLNEDSIIDLLPEVNERLSKRRPPLRIMTGNPGTTASLPGVKRSHDLILQKMVGKSWSSLLNANAKTIFGIEGEVSTPSNEGRFAGGEITFAILRKIKDLYRVFMGPVYTDDGVAVNPKEVLNTLKSLPVTLAQDTETGLLKKLSNIQGRQSSINFGGMSESDISTSAILELLEERYGVDARNRGESLINPDVLERIRGKIFSSQYQSMRFESDYGDLAAKRTSFKLENALRIYKSLTHKGVGTASGGTRYTGGLLGVLKNSAIGLNFTSPMDNALGKHTDLLNSKLFTTLLFYAEEGGSDLKGLLKNKNLGERTARIVSIFENNMGIKESELSDLLNNGRRLINDADFNKNYRILSGLQSRDVGKMMTHGLITKIGASGKLKVDSLEVLKRIGKQFGLTDSDLYIGKELESYRSSARGATAVIGQEVAESVKGPIATAVVNEIPDAHGIFKKVGGAEGLSNSDKLKINEVMSKLPDNVRGNIRSALGRTGGNSTLKEALIANSLKYVGEKPTWSEERGFIDFFKNADIDDVPKLRQVGGSFMGVGGTALLSNFLNLSGLASSAIGRTLMPRDKTPLAFASEAFSIAPVVATLIKSKDEIAAFSKEASSKNVAPYIKKMTPLVPGFIKSLSSSAKVKLLEKIPYLDKVGKTARILGTGALLVPQMTALATQRKKEDPKISDYIKGAALELADFGLSLGLGKMVATYGGPVGIAGYLASSIYSGQVDKLVEDLGGRNLFPDYYREYKETAYDDMGKKTTKTKYELKSTLERNIADLPLLGRFFNEYRDKIFGKPLKNKKNYGPYGFAVGGKVPNTPNLSQPFGTDSVLAALTPGEFVIRKEAVQALGTPYLNALNSVGAIQKHQFGGSVLDEEYLAKLVKRRQLPPMYKESTGRDTYRVKDIRQGVRGAYGEANKLNELGGRFARSASSAKNYIKNNPIASEVNPLLQKINQPTLTNEELFIKNIKATNDAAAKAAAAPSPQALGKNIPKGISKNLIPKGAGKEVLKGVGKFAGPAVAVGGAVLTGIDEYKETESVVRGVSTGTGALAGGLTGTAIGAGIGTAIFPVVGTGIGAIIGGIGGTIAGTMGGRSIGEILDPEAEKRMAEKYAALDKANNLTAGELAAAQAMQAQVQANVVADKEKRLAEQQQYGTMLNNFAPPTVYDTLNEIPEGMAQIAGVQPKVTKLANAETVKKRLEFMYSDTADNLLLGFQRQGYDGKDLVSLMMNVMQVKSADALNKAITGALDSSELTAYLMKQHGAQNPSALMNIFTESWPAFKTEGAEDTAVEFAARYHGSANYAELEAQLHASAAEIKERATADVEANLQKVRDYYTKEMNEGGYARAMQARATLKNFNFQMQQFDDRIAEAASANYPNPDRIERLKQDKAASVQGWSNTVDRSLASLDAIKQRGYMSNMPQGYQPKPKEMKFDNEVQERMYLEATYGPAYQEYLKEYPDASVSLKSFIDQAKFDERRKKGFSDDRVRNFEMLPPSGISVNVTRQGLPAQTAEMASRAQLEQGFNATAPSVPDQNQVNAGNFAPNNVLEKESFSKYLGYIQGALDTRLSQVINEFDNNIYDPTIRALPMFSSPDSLKNTLNEYLMNMMPVGSLSNPGMYDLFQEAVNRKFEEGILKNMGLYAEGGLVSGPKALSGFGTDTVFGAMTPGEFVFNRGAVNNLGLDLLTDLNSGRDWSEIRESYSNKEHNGAYRQSFSKEVENSTVTNESGQPVMYLTAQETDSTHVLNTVYDILRRELKGMNVNRTFMPF